jgi:alkylhydroperoxidase family enzyme
MVPIAFGLSALLLISAGPFPLLIGRAVAAQDAEVRPDLAHQWEARFPLIGDAEAWERLPEAEEGGGGPLPAWARALAKSLPRTTAAMLELDWLHRAGSSLDPSLRGMMRWTVAHANRCDYSKAYAVADLLRAGLEQTEIDALIAQRKPLPEAEQAAIHFARQLTKAADTLTDEEVARLLEWYGDKQLVAMVLLVAHANFQDRLFLSLGLNAERGGPLPPASVRFAKDQSGKPIIVPERKKAIDEPPSTGEITTIEDPSWLAVDFSTLQSRLEAQRDRAGRIRIPTWDEVRDWLPERSRRNDPLRIQWSLVCLGYQPQPALAWSACTRAFAEEARQDRVFEESLFWVITRTIHCFY